LGPASATNIGRLAAVGSAQPVLPSSSGHVDNTQGQAVFFQLRTLVAGDQVTVQLADGVTTQFAVRSVAMYAKPQFPAAQVYGWHGDDSLQLVTCGGTFDPGTGSYLSNVVVYTTLVSATLADGTVEHYGPTSP
jgi:hypothetical protein